MDQNIRKGIVFGYRTVDLPTSSSRPENRSEEMKGSRLDPIGLRKDTRYVDEDDHSSNHRVNDWVRRYNLHESSDSENLSIEKDSAYSKFSGQPRIAGNQGRHPYYGYPDDGLASKTSGPLYGYGEKMWNYSVPNKPNSEQDQVEIMRTLDELKDQLNRYCRAVDKPRFNNERAFPDRYYENIQVSRPVDREKVYPPRHDLAMFEDQFHAQMNRKVHDQLLPHEFDFGRKMEINQFSHHPSQCVPTRNPQSAFDRVNPKDFLSANLNRIGSPLNLGHRNSSPHGSDYAPSRDVRPRERWTSDPESDGDSLSGLRRPVIRRKNEQYCRSIAGGAPFIACYNCFELLKLPRNLMKGKNKLQCGACSSIIDVQIEKKRVIISSSKESNLVSSELDSDLRGLKAPKNGSSDFADSGGKSNHILRNSGQKSTLEDQELKLNSPEKKQSVSLSSADKFDRNSKCSDHKSTLEDQELNLSLSEKKQNASSSSADKFDQYSDHKSAVEDQELKLSSSEKMQSVSSSSSNKSDLNLKNSEQKSTLDDQELKLSLSEKKLIFSSDHHLKNPDQKSTLEDQELKLSFSEKKKCISSSSSDQNLKNPDQKSTDEAQELKLNSSEKRPSVSSSSDFSDGEEIPSPHILPESTSNSAKPASSSTENTPPFDEQSDQSNSGINISDKVHFSQNSIDDISESMESEDFFDEYPHTQTSQDSIEASKEEDRKAINLTDRVKKRDVYVNGHPIPDDLVKKAEKMAGNVLPGDYWYDYRAGFWGVMGNPCLGIVPPFIEEFNYPMPTNCAAGNTGVYVNGRELHQNDLDLLAGRGLPTISSRFYMIDISGKVVDEDSGEELYYLGKLAPTIEKMKRGFGMKVLRPIV